MNRLALARIAARALRIVPLAPRLRLIVAMLRALGGRHRVRGGPAHCTACDSRLAAFAPGAAATVPARLLRLSPAPPNPRLYRGAARHVCPVCLEPERSRFLLHVLAGEGLLDRGGAARDVLVSSGGPALMSHLVHHRLVSSNLHRTLFADVACDLNAAPFADAAFDVILCVCVIDLIADEARALAELRRCLRPDGVLWLGLPHDETLAVTEDLSDAPEAARRARFVGAHMRLYGDDTAARLEAAGFAVETLRAAAQVDPATIARTGLQPDDRLYRCTRR